jgi:Xaa-Pro aminopeptidase
MTKPSPTYAEKLKDLRTKMHDYGLDAYIVPRGDEYQGEFVAPYAERLKWLTGFTGSGGTALVFKDKAIVLTDGRYLIQVAAQVDNELFDTGDYVKKTTAKWLAENVGEGSVIGYDPFLFTPKQIEALVKECSEKGAKLKAVKDNLIDAIWKDQPSKPQGKAIPFPEDIAGISAAQKIENVVDAIKEEGGRALILTLPDSIAWLLNVRGSDIDYIPSVLSYLIVSTRGNVRWFVDPAKITDEVREALPSVVSIYPPKEMGLQFMALAQKSRESELPILMDMRYTPIQIKTMIEERGGEVRDFIDPSIKPKAQKTSQEVAAIRKAHIEDGVALVKFLKWLDEEGVGQTEISVSEKLKSLRSQSQYFKGNSFPTIAGFGSNGAIVHYRAEEKTNKTLEEGGLLLIDSGGQYAGDDCYGTTDITRTIAIGEPTQEMRENYTHVLKGHIGVAQARFPKGTVGAQVDALARKPLWDAGLDFAHGTGHGVGCYLAVHEEAANISPRGQTPFEAGMLISNEPGYYKEGEYGIRIENLILTIEKNDMFSFDTISFAPFDRKLIEVDMLSRSEKKWLKEYNKAIVEALSSYLESEEVGWLTNACNY